MLKYLSRFLFKYCRIAIYDGGKPFVGDSIGFLKLTLSLDRRSMRGGLEEQSDRPIAWIPFPNPSYVGLQAPITVITFTAICCFCRDRPQTLSLLPMPQIITPSLTPLYSPGYPSFQVQHTTKSVN